MGLHGTSVQKRHGYEGMSLTGAEGLAGSGVQDLETASGRSPIPGGGGSLTAAAGLSREVATGWLYVSRISQDHLLVIFSRKKYNLLVLEKTLILLCGLHESSRNKARDVSTLSTALRVSFCACPGLVILRAAQISPVGRSSARRNRS